MLPSFKMLLAIAGVLLLVSVQNMAVTSAVAVRLAPATCSSLHDLLQPATVGAIAGGIVSIIGAMGLLLERIGKAGPPPPAEGGKR